MKSYFSFFYVCFRIRILSLFHSATQTMAILNLNGQAKLIFALLVFNQSQYSGLNNLQSQTDRHFPFKEINFLCMQSTQDKYFVYKYFVYSYFVYRYFVHRYFVYSIHASRLSMQGCVAVAYASLGFHMQFTEDIYLRVNQTTQQNTTQDNKTFICKPSTAQ